MFWSFLLPQSKLDSRHDFQQALFRARHSVSSGPDHDLHLDYSAAAIDTTSRLGAQHMHSRRSALSDIVRKG